jgi:uncharacterized membrane protein YvlD (DUF360 family)
MSDTKLCPSCGTSNPTDANLCYKCGYSYHSGPYSQPPRPNQQSSTYANPHWQQPQQSNYYRAGDGFNTSGVDAMAIVSLVLGIISIVGSCVYCVALPLAVVGLVLGAFGLRGNQRGIAIAGLICCGLGVLSGIGFAIYVSRLVWS